MLLCDRVCTAVQFAVSGDHAGLVPAIREVPPEATRQRCYLQFLRNALNRLPCKANDGYWVLLHLRRRESDMPLNRRGSRNPLSARRWFSDDVILVSVGWYRRFKLSYRELAHILG